MIEFDRRALERLANDVLGDGTIEIEAMPGGASTRRYFRVRQDRARAVAMFVPDAMPEEVTSGAHVEWPFLEVQKLLEARGVRVPKLLGSDCDRGLLLLEDLGDETLAAFLERAPHRKAEIYDVAVRDLARAQKVLADLPADSVVRTRAFDEKLLRWELDHYREWGRDAVGRPFSPEDRATFDRIADRTARAIAELPRGFVHRDYQSRNLMVHADGAKEELVWIDFQDALMGPRVYDLVALLCDSYQTFDRAFIDARLRTYAEEAGLDAKAFEQLAFEFDLVTVQRKLKDAGRFVFIDRVKKNPSFLPYIEPSLAKVKAALERLRDSHEDVRELERIVF